MKLPRYENIKLQFRRLKHEGVDCDRLDALKKSIFGSLKKLQKQVSQTPSTKRIGILAITADPIHWGHIESALRAMVAFNLAQIIILPQGDGGNKSDKVSKKHRHFMTEAALADFYPVLIYSSFALENNEPGEKNFLNYVLNHQKDAAQFYYVCGDDITPFADEIFTKLFQCFFNNYPHWQKRLALGVIPRDSVFQSAPMQALRDCGVIVVEDNHPVSGVIVTSTEIRKKRALHLLPLAVREYVIKNGLYGIAKFMGTVEYEQGLERRYGLVRLVGDPYPFALSSAFTNGKANPSYGISIIKLISPWEVVYGKIRKLQQRIINRIKEAGLADSIYFMVPDSWHATIYDLDPEWVGGMQPPLKKITDEVLSLRLRQIQEVYKKLGILGEVKTHVRGIGVSGEGSIVVKIHFESRSDLDKLLHVRSLTAEHTGIELPSFAAHISLGYLWRQIPYNKYEKFLEVMRRFENSDCGEWNIDRISISYYNTLSRFHPIIAKNFRDGSIVKSHFDAKLLNGEFEQEVNSETEQNYGPLIPTKWAYHRKHAAQIMSGRFDSVRPVTVHLAPTLSCNHRCFFCTYGGCKSGRLIDAKQKEEIRSDKKEMSFTTLKRIVDELADVGVKGIIITGGGEPTAYRHLESSMAYIKSKNIDIAMNTNGSLLHGQILDGILATNPRYIRISLNAGSDEVHRLTTGLNNFEKIISNIKNIIIRRNQLKAETDISVGYVVNTANVHDIMSFVQRMVAIEEEFGVEKTIYSLQLRPVSNYESSKHLNEEKISKVTDYLNKAFGNSYSEEFLDFMYRGVQISERTLRQAVRVIEDEAIPFLQSKDSKIQIFYPKQKYLDIPKVRAKPYNRCYVCPFFLFIWPNGNVYHCIEWAGTVGFETGNLENESLRDILKGEKRAHLLRNIDEQIIHTRCAPICAHHEMNMLLDSLDQRRDKKKMINQIRREFPNPKHINFL